MFSFFFFAKLKPFWDRSNDSSRLMGEDGKFSGYLIVKVGTQWFDCWFGGAAYRREHGVSSTKERVFLRSFLSPEEAESWCEGRYKKL